MPRKKQIREQFSDTPIHNSPDQFFYCDVENDLTLISVGDSIARAPLLVTGPRVALMENIDIVQEWITANHLDGTWKKWYDLIAPLLGCFRTDTETREKLFGIWRESHLAKLNIAIKTLKQARDTIKKSDVPLMKEQNYLGSQLNSYIATHETLNKEKTGKHKLLYDHIGPLINGLESGGLNQDTQARVLKDLFQRFNYDEFGIISDNHSLIKRAEKIIISARKFM